MESETMNDPRMFWLKSDRKTVQEVDRPTAMYLLKRSHLVYVHSNGDFFTNRGYIVAAQFKQILGLCYGKEA